MLIKRNWVVFVRVLPIAPYSARDWLSIDTFSLEIIQQWDIFWCQNLQRQCKCEVWSKYHGLVKIHKTFNIPAMVSLVLVTMVP